MTHTPDIHYDYDSVVVTIKGWDGSRIIGAFANLDCAKTAIKSYYENTHDTGTFKEEVIIDFLKLNRISKVMTIQFERDSELPYEDLTLRYHDYV